MTLILIPKMLQHYTAQNYSLQHLSGEVFPPISEETLLRTVIPPDAMLNALLTKKKGTPKTHLIFYVESDGETRHFLGKESLKKDM